MNDLIFNKDYPWLYYNKENGNFYWVGKSSKTSKVKPGSFASKVRSNGYRYVFANGKQVKSCRLAWYFNFGEWPNFQIDHVNGDRSDDRIENLRDVTSSENNKNRKKPNTNKTGVIGVCLTACGYQAYIYRDNKKIHLGTYECITAAIVSRKLAEIKYGFHKNHGRK